MLKEVSSAVDFLTQMMRPSCKDEDRLSSFNENLKQKIEGHYQDHWFPEKPFKGSGYRCLRINHNMEPIILQAAAESGLTREDLLSMLPNELTLWIDPREVSYRIGEEGSVGILYEEEKPKKVVQKAVQKSPSPVPVPSQSPVQMSPLRTSPVHLSPVHSPARSPVQHHSPVHSPIPQQFHSPQRNITPSPVDFISWDMFEPNLNISPSRYHQLAQQYQQHCSRESYLQHQNFNDAYDLKRLAAFVYS